MPKYLITTYEPVFEVVNTVIEVNEEEGEEEAVDKFFSNKDIFSKDIVNYIRDQEVEVVDISKVKE